MIDKLSSEKSVDAWHHRTLWAHQGCTSQWVLVKVLWKTKKGKMTQLNGLKPNVPPPLLTFPALAASKLHLSLSFSCFLDWQTIHHCWFQKRNDFEAMIKSRKRCNTHWPCHHHLRSRCVAGTGDNTLNVSHPNGPWQKDNWWARMSHWQS